MAFDRSKALKVAQKHLAKGNLDKAITEFERLVADDPSDARILLKLGDIYTKKGDQKKACETYRKVADRYAEQGFFLKAVAIFKQILKLDATQLDAWEKLAEMYELLSLVSDALSTYEQVAAAYTRAGNNPRALDAMAKMAQLDPENVATTIKYAEALSRVHRKQEAVDAFMQGATVLKRQGRLDDYMKVAERLLFHQPDNVEVARDLASMYLERRDPKHALAKLQSCFKADPRDLQTLDLLARAFDSLGQTPKAVSVYREMDRILQERGDQAGQRDVLQRLLAIEPNDAEARQSLARLGAAASAGPTAESVPVIDVSDDPTIQAVDPDEDDIILVDDEDSGLLPVVTGGSGLLEPDKEQEAVRQRIDRMLGEVDAFIRYRLHEKVEEQLKAVLELDPDHVLARVKLGGFFADAGRNREAAEQYVIAARARGVDPSIARQYMELASELDPAAATSAHPTTHESNSDERPTTNRPRPEVEEAGDDDIIFLDDEGDDAVLEGDDDDLVFDEPVNQEAAFFGTEGALDAEPEMVLEDASDEDARLIAEAESEATTAPDGNRRIAPPTHRPVAPATVPPAAPPVSPPASVNALFSGAPAGPTTVSREAAPGDLDVAARPASVPNAVAGEAGLAAGLDEPSLDEAGLDEAGLDESGLAEADASEEVDEAIEEADFYRDQGLIEDAVESINEALKEFPNHPALIAKLRELTAPQEDGDGEDNSFALAETLAKEEGSVAPSRSGEEIAVEDVLAQFKAGVERSVDKGDVATHYDLGIAYMEMGLHNEAISEFELCLNDPGRRCQAHTMIAFSHVSEAKMEDAIRHFQAALECDPAEEEQLELWFELGNAHELLGKASEALIYYEKVEEVNPEYRDVAARIERLGVPPTPKDEDDEFDAMFDNMILKD